MTSPPDRPSFRDLFLTEEKQLEVYFYTSSIEKFLQARVVCEYNGLVLRHFKGRVEPYSEDYSYGKQRLLERAVREVVSSVGKSSLVFVEDTSLRIEALSSVDCDFPGLAVKEWFATTSFEELDAQLRQKGNNRKAVVRSDIALHVPSMHRPVFFGDLTHGRVAETPPTFDEVPQYPWLTPSTFNGWFIPDGSDKRIGEMSFDESWRFDFRIKALLRLIDRLEEYSAVLNLPAQSYLRRRRSRATSQLPLLASAESALVVVGRLCAGKTTFGEHASMEHDLRFVEASSVLRTFRSEFEQDLDSFEFAKLVLEQKGPDVVARKIVQMFSDDFERGIVVSGFRTIEELEVMKLRVPQAKVVLVEASERTRFERHLRRGRLESARTLTEFRKLDSQQQMFGLLKVAEDFADTRIVNEGTLQEYGEQISAVITGRGAKEIPGISVQLRPRHKSEKNQLYKSLAVLNKAGRPMTCDEIEEATSEYGTRVRHNNANKVLKRVPELARRLELAGTRVRYEILNSGRAYLRYTDARTGEEIDS